MKKAFHLHRLFPVLLCIVLFCGTLCGCGASELNDALDALLDAQPLPIAHDAVVSTPAPIASAQTDGELVVHFIDVGQADCALVQCNGANMLIDGGNAADSSLVVAYLQQQGVETIDCIVCTHAHEDHVGGLSGALNAFDVRRVLCSVTDYDSKAFANFVKYTAEEGLSIEVPRAGDRFDFADAQVTILGPVDAYPDTNDMSIVLRIDFGSTRFLFTGDAESASEHDLLQSGADVDATLLKVGHHGSDTSSSYVFLREVTPAYAVVSVAKENTYDHPSPDTLSRLRDVGAQVYRTDEQGDIVAVSDGDTIVLTTEK